MSTHSLPCEQWFLQAGRSGLETPLLAGYTFVCIKQKCINVQRNIINECLQLTQSVCSCSLSCYGEKHYCVDDTNNCFVGDNWLSLQPPYCSHSYHYFLFPLYRKIESKSGLLVPLNEGKLQKMSISQVKAQSAVGGRNVFCYYCTL